MRVLKSEADVAWQPIETVPAHRRVLFAERDSHAQGGCRYWFGSWWPEDGRYADQYLRTVECAAPEYWVWAPLPPFGSPYGTMRSAGAQARDTDAQD